MAQLYANSFGYLLQNLKWGFYELVVPNLRSKHRRITHKITISTTVNILWLLETYFLTIININILITNYGKLWMKFSLSAKNSTSVIANEIMFETEKLSWTLAIKVPKYFFCQTQAKFLYIVKMVEPHAFQHSGNEKPNWALW